MSNVQLKEAISLCCTEKVLSFLCNNKTFVCCFYHQEPTAGLGIILDSVCGMFPHLLTPLLQLLQALVSDKSTAKKVQDLSWCLGDDLFQDRHNMLRDNAVWFSSHYECISHLQSLIKALCLLSKTGHLLSPFLLQGTVFWPLVNSPTLAEDKFSH